MRHLVHEAGLDGEISVDSAGTAAYHAGEAPDRRARQAAQKRGIELGGRARKFERADWERFEYVIAMDRENHADLRDEMPKPAYQEKLFLLRSFDPQSTKNAGVPDPYYGGADGFDQVLDICEAGCRGLLNQIRKKHDL